MPWDDLYEPRGPSKEGSPPPGGPAGGPQFDFPRFRMPRFNPASFAGIAAILFLIWLLPGIFFIVEPDEEGVVTRFGKFDRLEQPGLHVKLPTPIEHVDTPKVKIVRRAEIGFRILSPGPPPKVKDMPAESLMLTGDQNIVDIDMVVQYQVRDAVAFLFNIQDKEKVVRNVAETVLRGIVGSKNIDEALTTGKNEIQVLAKDQIQNLLDKYNAGIQVVTTQLQDVHPPSQVAAAFKDVVSAREDKERMINEAQGYRKAVIPEARGKAAQMVRQAEAYKEEKIKMAEGDAQKFVVLHDAYKKAPAITRRRIYLETMEDVLPEMRKVIVSQDIKSLMPVLPLGQAALPLPGAAAEGKRAAKEQPAQ